MDAIDRNADKHQVNDSSLVVYITLVTSNSAAARAARKFFRCIEVNFSFSYSGMISSKVENLSLLFF